MHHVPQQPSQGRKTANSRVKRNQEIKETLRGKKLPDDDQIPIHQNW